MGTPTPQRFEELAALPDDAIDVACGAALIARDADGSVEVPELLRRFDSLAAPLRELDLAARNPAEQARALAEHVYGTLGFSGNESDYYDPRNSLLDHVLERRLGIPITLAIVYGEIARRAGVRTHGVAFPGHFLVRVETGDPAAPVIVDPFFGGRVLDEEAQRKLYVRVTGKDVTPPPAMLEAASPRVILVRVLVNLRAVYLSRGDLARALLAIDRILSLTPDAAEPLRERGLLSARLGATAAAIADLERFLAIAPHADDIERVRSRVAELKGKRPRAN